MGLLFKNMRGIVAMAIVIGTLAFDYFLYFKGIPTVNKELAYTAAGGLNTMCAQIASYFFGSSKDKSDQEKSGRGEGADTKTTETKTEKIIESKPIEEVKP